MNEQDLFIEAMSCPGPEERKQFLDEVCRNSPTLRQRIDCLLQHSALAEDYLEQPPEAFAEMIASPTVGSQIGPYVLREQIGEGGMGVVYVAEQTVPVKRKVALKIMKSGLATKEVVARFEAERQAQAMMDHPHIARVYDAGATDSGQPYVVMELVHGLPITEYCDRRKFDTRERLQLFAAVCKAVHHAHQKGIIHRDLKPTNVLVAEIDGKAIPKVIDFGVAKAVSDKLTQQTLYTNFSQMVGTPLYMSPEQASMGVIDVDTRSDVYSLGVLLYELLTSKTPFDSATLKAAGFDEMRRIIREDEPNRPSILVNTLAIQGESTAASCRAIDVRRLSSLLRRELDWMVMKSLEKDRSRRYGSAMELADDIHRYLTDDVVTARPPSMMYASRKFVGRHRGPFFAAATILATILVGLMFAVSLMARAAQRERRLAEQMAHDQQRAEENFQFAVEAVDRMVEHVTEDLRHVPGTQDSQEALLQDALNVYQRMIREQQFRDLTTYPDLQSQIARAHMKVGVISRVLGHATQAEEAWRQAIAIWERLGTTFPGVSAYQEKLLESYPGLSYQLMLSGRHQERLTVARKGLTVALQLTKDYPTTLGRQRLVAQAHSNLGIALCKNRQWAESEKHHRQAVALRHQIAEQFPDQLSDREGLAHAYHWLGQLLLNANKLDEAEHELRRCLALREQIAANSSSDMGDVTHLQAYTSNLGRLAHIKAYMSYALKAQGKLHEAKGFASEAVAHREQLIVDFPNDVQHIRRLAVNYEFLADLLAAMGRLDECETILKQWVDLFEKPDFPQALRNANGTGEANYRLGLVYHAMGRAAQSVYQFRLAFTDLERRLTESPGVTRRKASLAWCLVDCPVGEFRDPARAIDLCNESLQAEADPSRYWRTLGLAQCQIGQFEAAVRSLDKCTDSGSNEVQLKFMKAMAHWKAGRKDAARALFEDASEWMEQHQPMDLYLKRYRTEVREVM